MMGVLENEVDQLLKDSQAKLRIAGFEEEERRMKERLPRRPQHSLKLPPGPYIFCDFRTLEIPGIKLNPPPSEALKRMHMLAADPGIVAIMNKHRWRVGIMTEMAPEGYVGISPVCLVGLNKNHGEEISLRLRTDDLKGFRKYASIKKTLLHKLDSQQLCIGIVEQHWTHLAAFKLVREAQRVLVDKQKPSFHDMKCSTHIITSYEYH